MLNGIVWNRTDYLHKITYKGWYAIKTNQPTKMRTNVLEKKLVSSTGVIVFRIGL